MLQPKRTKFRKQQKSKGSEQGMATRGHQIAFGTFAIKTLEPGWITARQIEAARISVTRAMKREGQVWIRIFPDKPYTKKALEVPMGGGKGSVEMYRAPVKPGRIIFEMGDIAPEVAREAFTRAAYKLPVQTKIILSKTDF